MLRVTNGAQFQTTTSGSAQAGNINLQVTENITLSGQSSGIFANTSANSRGDGGSINIDPEIFIIEDGAEIASDSQGSGQGGSITLEAGSLFLDNGSITAESASNQGGEIILTIPSLLQLSNESSISATAGKAGAGGDGGNVDIDAGFMIVFPPTGAKGSNIQANASEGNGGVVTINTQGIFGIQFREQQTSLNDITATSESGLQGTVAISQPNVDPAQSLDTLPVNLVEATSLIANTCPVEDGEESKFIVTGRGGLPANPGGILTNTNLLVDWVTLDEDFASEIESGEFQQLTTYPSSVPILEATGIEITSTGKVVLSATNPTNFHNSWLAAYGCKTNSSNLN